MHLHLCNPELPGKHHPHHRSFHQWCFHKIQKLLGKSQHWHHHNQCCLTHRMLLKHYHQNYHHHCLGTTSMHHRNHHHCRHILQQVDKKAPLNSHLQIHLHLHQGNRHFEQTHLFPDHNHCPTHHRFLKHQH